MDKKFEDKIARMAFGELSEAEATEVRAHAAANADAAQALASYEAIRSDLRRMKDVPPDQLSKERLQNAILTQGLRPKPVRRAFPFAWVTSAAATVLVGFVLLNNMSPDQVVVNTPTANPAGSIAAPVLNFEDQQQLERQISDFTATLEAPAAPIRDSSVADATPVRPRPVNRTTPRSGYRAPTDRSGPDNLLALRSSAKANHSTEAESDSLVLINNDKDYNTGASTAVEVRSTETQDVVVSS
jgi:hypothetical protein